MEKVNPITPIDAARLARAVYLLVQESTPERAMKTLKADFDYMLDFADAKPMMGRTGGKSKVWSTRTGMAVVLKGKGPFKGQLFVVFRGTKILADLLTDGSVTSTKSANHHPVHAGFFRAFLSLLREIWPLIREANDCRVVHCIGHSLGGALATLCAEYIALRKSTLHPILYTFGSPRVGLEAYVCDLARRLHPSNIYRVYHPSDIITCTPPWPYYHVPPNARAFEVGSAGLVPMMKYHAMARYVTFNGMDSPSWKQLQGLSSGMFSDHQIMQWLKRQPEVGFFTRNIERLGRAISLFLRRMIRAGMTVAAMLSSYALGSNVGTLDQIAYLLHSSKNLSAELGQFARAVIGHAMALLGMAPLRHGMELTHDFIRDVLIRVMDRANMLARQTLHQTLNRRLG